MIFDIKLWIFWGQPWRKGTSLWLRTWQIVDSIPNRRNEIFNICISSLWCRGKIAALSSAINIHKNYSISIVSQNCQTKTFVGATEYNRMVTVPRRVVTRV